MVHAESVLAQQYCCVLLLHVGILVFLLWYGHYGEFPGETSVGKLICLILLVEVHGIVLLLLVTWCCCIVCCFCCSYYMVLVQASCCIMVLLLAMHIFFDAAEC
jgi:hypothetical protein